MSVIATAKRRRRQFAKKHRHLAKLGRPIYPRAISASKSAARLRKLLETERRIQQGKNKSKGKKS